LKGFVHGGEVLSGDAVFDHVVLRRGNAEPGLLATQAGQQRPHLVQLHGVIDVVALERVARHGRPFGVRRILDHRGAPYRLDGDQPVGAVIQQTGQHHPDHPPP
jgi:hypothetical protein